MDECDMGAAAAAKYLAGELRAQKERSNMGGPIFKWCQDCGARIPKKRLAALRRAGLPGSRCVKCQSRFERGVHGGD